MAHDVVLTETFFSTVEQFETEDAKRVINKLEDIGDFPEHSLDRLKNHPGYKFRVGDFRVLVDWDKDTQMIYAIDVFEQKQEFRELGSIVKSGNRDATTSRGGVCTSVSVRRDRDR